MNDADSPWLVQWSLALAGIAVALSLLVPAVVWLRSETVIERRYPLPSSTVEASREAKPIARGTHLVAIAGCADCHGSDLEGRLQGRDTVLPVWSSNLRLDAHAMSDEEFERAIRYGIRPASTSTWRMPAMDYTYMSEDDVAAIVSYLRTLAPSGTAKPPPEFDFRARMAIVTGDLVPVAERTLESPTSVDLGPRYDGGRYLSRIACADCHGTDLTGNAEAPDLATVGHYSHNAFFALLRTGSGARGETLPTMTRLARSRFSRLFDYEIDALYDYLAARAKVMNRR